MAFNSWKSPGSPKSERREQYVENMMKSPPVGQEGENIRRADVTRLTSGKEVELKLSAAEAVRRDGWDLNELARAGEGSIVMNIRGDAYEVLSTKGKKMKIREVEEGYQGEITCTPRTIKAHEYRYRAYDSLGKAKIIIVYDLAYQDRTLDTSDLIDDLICALPAQHFNSVDQIRIDREIIEAAGSCGKTPSLLSKDNIITLHVDPFNHSLPHALETLYHELGHAIATSITGSAHPGEKWKRAMDADMTSLSEYASETRYPNLNDNGEIEDFAEAVKLYLATDGAKDSKYAELRQACENRFRILDELFENPIYQQRFSTRSAIGRLLRKQDSPLS